MNKRIIYLIFISTFIFINPLYSYESFINLSADITNQEISYKMTYNDEIIEDLTQPYEIQAITPLTTDGKTKNIAIYASGNNYNSLSFNVEIIPSSFILFYSENNDDIFYDSGIIPRVNTITNINLFPQGYFTNLLIYEFNLSWEGKTNLPAGQYISTETLIYTIK
ncbi:MAG: hypothetical protein ACPKM0_02070 [Pleomorphochaeta sp.]